MQKVIPQTSYTTFYSASEFNYLYYIHNCQTKTQCTELVWLCSFKIPITNSICECKPTTLNKVGQLFKISKHKSPATKI